MPKRGTTSLRGKHYSPPISESPSCPPVTPCPWAHAATCEGIARDYLAHRGHEVRVADGWSCDCEDAPIVATDGDETVLIAVISAYEEGSARMPELSVDAAEFTIMRRACLL